MTGQTNENRQLAETIARLQGQIETYRRRIVIEDDWGRRYRLEVSRTIGTNTDDPGIVLKIRQEPLPDI